MTKKLNKKEFFDIYVLSLITNKRYHYEGLKILLPIAQKYYDITCKAIRGELRHMFVHSDLCIINKKDFLKKYNIKNWAIERKKLPLFLCYKFFTMQTIKYNRNIWDDCYDGEKWGEITRVCINLQKELENPNFLKLITILDSLNQLEHNSCLYLKNQTTFDLIDALDVKFDGEVREILHNSSIKAKMLYNRANREEVSLTAYFHNQKY